MSVTEQEKTAVAAPEPFMRGQFSLYETPDGGVHVAVRFAGEEEDRHHQVPAVIVEAAKEAMATGQMPSPLKLLKLLHTR